MEIKILLDNEFSDINKNEQLENELAKSFKSFNIELFTQNLEKYLRSLNALFKTYINKINEAIALYESRLDKQTLYAQNDTKYNKAIKLYDCKKYYEAYLIFNTILNHRDSRKYFNEAYSFVIEKYNEGIYLYNHEKYKEAIAIFQFIELFLKSKQYISKCSSALIAKEDELRKQAAEADKKRKKRKTLTAISSFAAVAVVVLILVFTVFIPQENQKKYNSALSLLNGGYYSIAASQFDILDFKDSKEQLFVANACIAFKSGDFNNGIKEFCNANGTINISYNANGGTCSLSTEIITTSKIINITASKDYYTFTGWEINDFLIDTKENLHICNLNLIANYELTKYSILYNLNGGTNNSENPSSITYEDTIIVNSPTKDGHTFLGWKIDSTSSCSLNPQLSCIGSNKTLTAIWEINKYKIKLDCDGCDIDNTIIDCEYSNSPVLPNPSKLGETLIGWYYGDTKVTSSWKMPSQDVILSAKWENACLKYLIYDYYYYTRENGLIITGMKSGYTNKVLIIPDSIDDIKVMAIAKNAFINLNSITYVVIPKSVTKIATGAFAGFGSLQKIVLPFVGTANETNFGSLFGSKSFSGATLTKQYQPYNGQASNFYKNWYIPSSLTDVEITTNTSISPVAFSNCSNIEKITLVSGTSIGEKTFYNCNATVMYE